MAWLESIAGPEYASALMWTIFALIALLVLLVIIKIVRGLTFGTFIAGGRNRKARLAVMDATAVDSQRRLVLVRRDDVEHLVLIGGPTDVVVEQGIRVAAAARNANAESGRTAPPDAGRIPVPVPPRAPREQPHEPRVAAPAAPATVAGPVQPKAAAPAPPVDDPVLTPAPNAAATEPAGPPPMPAGPMVQPARTAVAPVSPPPANPGVRPQPPETLARAQPAPAVQPPQAERPAMPAPGPAQATGSFATMKPVVATPMAPAPASDNLDDALLQELQVTLDREAKPVPAPTQPPAPAQEREMALEEEMSRLLGDIATRR